MRGARAAPAEAQRKKMVMQVSEGADGPDGPDSEAEAEAEPAVSAPASAGPSAAADPDPDAELAADALAPVGIAASAGGLEAMSLLARNLPRDQNCAYVLAQHMSPSHKSMLVQLLSRETTLAVRELDGPTAPQPGTIYVPPPGFDVIAIDGMFDLREPEGHPASPKPSADRLFKSLAREFGSRCVGLVLSGTGSDGSYGVQAIREAGGITIAQDPASCKYDSMPVSAVHTGCIDLSLTPQQMGQHLAMILKRPRDLTELRDINDRGRPYNDLFQILLAHTLVDFRNYKDTTIERRIHRRMVAKGVERYPDYVDLCRRSVEEVEALYRDLLISVTQFFRDPHQFEALGEAMRDLAARLDAEQDEPIRIWVPGCATGEEAYTIAILVAEALGGPEKLAERKVQIFASDIDENALAIARRCAYPASALNDIPERLLAPYFDLTDGLVRLKPAVRNSVMFSRHNVFQDAPFMNIDMVSIRNVLIYFNARLQERVLTRIQYALKPDGLLFLGTSETTGTMEGYFQQTTASAKLFRKRSGPNRGGAGLISASALGLQTDQGSEMRRGGAAAAPGAHRFDALARTVAPNSMLVNGDKVVLKVYGDVSPFVALTEAFPGGMNLSILRRPLSTEAASMLLVAQKHGETRQGQWHEFDARDFNACRMTVHPILGGAAEENLFLIGFQTEQRAVQTPRTDAAGDDYTAYLEGELSRTHETLQVAIEQLQTSNEELQSLNEEMQSSNEELQSTNEELETSNEELQSTNEELITVNEELIVNSAELQRLTVELNGLVDGIPSAMMMLDQGLLIRHASFDARERFGLRDHGHSMGHLSQARLPAGFPPLLDLCSQLLLDRKPVSRHFEMAEEVHHLTLKPLEGQRGELLGVIVNVVSMGYAVEPAINRALRRIDQFGAWQLNVEDRTVSLSRRAAQMHGIDRDLSAMPLRRLADLYLEEDRAEVERRITEAVEAESSFHVVARVARGRDDVAVVETSGSLVRDRMGKPMLMVGVCRDQTTETGRRLLSRLFEERGAALGLAFFHRDLETGLERWGPGAQALLGFSPEEPFSLDAVLGRLSEDARARVEALLSAVGPEGGPFAIEGDYRFPDGRVARCRLHGGAEMDDGRAGHLYGAFDLV